MPAPVITPVVTGTAPNQTIDLGGYTSQVNAGVSRAWASSQLQPDVVTGRAAVADGDEFQVLVGDEYVRYRRDSATTQTEVARFPSAAAVAKIAAPIPGVSLFENLFDDPGLTLRPVTDYLVPFSAQQQVFSLDAGQVFEGVQGPSLCITGSATASTWMGSVRMPGAAAPELLAAGAGTVAAFFKASSAARYQINNVGFDFAAGEVRLIQFPYTGGNVSWSIRQNPGTFAEGQKLWISPFIAYLGGQRNLRDMRSISNVRIRDKFMASGYRKQIAGVKNLWADHLLLNPDLASAGFAAAGGSAVSYDDSGVFDGFKRAIRTDFVAGGAEKLRVYWTGIRGYGNVRVGDVHQFSALFLSTVDVTLRIDAEGRQNNYQIKAGVEYHFEFERTATLDSDTNPTDGWSIPFLITGGATAGTFWITPPLFYKSRKKRPWVLAQVNDFEVEAKTRYTGLKLGMLGDSMSVNRNWQDMIVAKSGMFWNSTETTAGTGGRKPTAVGGTTLIPVENLGGNNANGTGAQNSIYMRAKDLIHYAPDILTIFAGINDKGSFLPYPGGKVQIGTINDTPLRNAYISAADWSANNIPAGFTMYSVLMGMIENILTDLPNVKMFMFTQYLHTARSGATGLPINVSPAVSEIIKLMNQCVRDVGKAYSIPIVDLEWNGQMPAFTFPAPSPWMSGDGTHLNAGGNDRIYNCLARTMGLS